MFITDAILFFIIACIITVVAGKLMGGKVEKNFKPSEEFIEKTIDTLKRQGVDPKIMWKYGK